MSKEQSSKVADLDALSDLCTPWCIHVAVTLSIAEHIAAGIDQIDDLAKATTSDPYVLHSMLSHLVSKRVFLEPSRGHFALNDAARELMDPARRFGLDLKGIGSRFAAIWSTLLQYVLSGQPAYKDLFGLPFWEDLDAHPALNEEFDALIGPAGHGTPRGDFQILGGWDDIHTVVDVGGGTGAMLAEALRLHPHVRGTLVDLPRTVARSKTVFEAAGVGERATTSGQSFFEPLPSGADLYWLRGIINDWPDRDSIQLLRRCAEASRQNGRVVILGGVGPDDAPRRLTIEMILVGGKHRSLSEFKELATQANLEILKAERQPAYFVVECKTRSV